MKRNIDINEISDGQLYTSDSMVKISCNDCNGCDKCCHNMGDSIILDPYDIYMLVKGTDKKPEQLLADELALGIVDGVILPHIAMKEDGSDFHCSFLNDGRCSVHEYRPGFCRLFPLGRIYNEDGTFDYINQVYECEHPNKSKVKVKKWLGIQNIARYERYIMKWHELIHKMEYLAVNQADTYKTVSVSFLNEFFIKPYDCTDFYEEFDVRIDDFIKQVTI